MRDKDEGYMSIMCLSLSLLNIMHTKRQEMSDSHDL